MKGSEHLDAVIVGAGPAGLSAALILARCNRAIAIFDDKRYRNGQTHSMHGYLSRDGIDPAQFRAIARSQVLAYPTVQFIEARVQDAVRHRDHFEVRTVSASFSAKKLLLATGVVDELPPIQGVEKLYGTRVFHCPYCDGWEWRDRRILALAPPGDALDFARELSVWTRDVTICLTRPPDKRMRRRIEDSGRAYRDDRIVRLELQTDGALNVSFEHGSPACCDAFFFSTREQQRCSLAETLGCRFTEGNLVICEAYAATNVPGLFVAGNASRGLHLAIIAASEGAQAAFAINEQLLAETHA